MPTYDYRCNSCSHLFEVFQSMSSRRLRKCPECGKPALERLLGAGAGVLFKGSGFYQTDYANKSSSGKPSDRKGADGDKPAKKPEASSGSGSAGKKSAGASEGP